MRTVTISPKPTATTTGIINEADYLLNDGVGIEIGAKLFDIPLAGNLNGTDLTPKILKRCEKNGFSVFVLGATETNLQSAIQHFRKDYPGLKIAGCHHGYFQSKHEIVAMINRSHADVLLVGMGVPLQEKFIAGFDQELSCTARLGVGAFIDLHPETYRVPRICSGNCGSSGCSGCCANRNGCGSEISAASSFCAGFCDINGNIHSLLFPALKGTGRAGREFRHVPKKEGNTRYLPTIKDVLFLFYKREKRVR